MLGLHCCMGFSLVAASGGPLSDCGTRASPCGGFSCCEAQALGSQSSAVVVPRLQSTGSAVVAHGLNCCTACGVLLVQGPNLCLLHWQADSLPLSHQGNPEILPFKKCFALILSCRYNMLSQV